MAVPGHNTPAGEAAAAGAGPAFISATTCSRCAHPCTTDMFAPLVKHSVALYLKITLLRLCHGARACASSVHRRCLLRRERS